jgi:hypothetical protein
MPQRGVPPEYDFAQLTGRSETAIDDMPHSSGGASALTAGVNFEGIPATGALPPDTVGDVGPNHYIQMVNTAFAIYDKSGNLLAGPSPISVLWSGFGGPCETEDDGDPIVQYDHLADRWLVSQFAVPGGAAGFHECIAISRGPNPVTDGWYRYDFKTPAFPDYPKIGVWPDAYYMSTYEGTNLGVFAFDRANMLAGNPATFVRFTLSSLSTISVRARTRILPADLEGALEPPPGTPNFFVRSVDGPAQGGGADRLEIFEFRVNFATPAASTFTGPASLPTAPYDIQMCGPNLPRPCIPQPVTDRRLDPLSNRLMRRLQYRNFGTHETLATNQTIDVDGQDTAGIRWYELRRQGGAWSIHQQGTHTAEDRTHRWMGGIAMDQDGNMALGYSVSGSRVFPGIRYAGRLASDPPGTLPQGEVTLAAGGGSQTHASARWGDYSSMNMDPTDDCTFWFTTEYYPTTSAAGWRTRIGSFKHPSCGVTPFEYAAKILCGLQKDPKDMRLARGFYATAINIHNPHRTAVTFTKKLALTFPPEEQRPGKVLPIGKDTLGYDEALEVDCMDVERELFPDGFPTPYIKGFIVIQTKESLDVTAVYSSASLNEEGEATSHSSLDVEQIRARRTGPSGLPDLVPVDKADPGAGPYCVLRDIGGWHLIVTIRNQGQGMAAASITEVDFLRGGSSFAKSSLPTDPLNMGQVDEVAFPLPQGWITGEDNYLFKITADVSMVVTETDETNNVANGTCKIIG